VQHKPDDEIKARARRLGLFGLLARWEDLADQPWIRTLLDAEETERGKRSLARRLHSARLGAFKPIADFDWKWPKRIDREAIEDLLKLTFLDEAVNVVLVGPNGVGKTTIAENLAYQAVLRGRTALKVTASQMLNDLDARDSSTALERRLRRYVKPALLLIDEVGYLSFATRHGDLLFEVISRRHGKKSIVLTTNKPFSEWNEVFPNSGCVTALVDRLVHQAEIIQIAGESYRTKEAKERAQRVSKDRQARRKQREEP
jgi:DNA replication protein DnaC